MKSPIEDYFFEDYVLSLSLSVYFTEQHYNQLKRAFNKRIKVLKQEINSRAK